MSYDCLSCQPSFKYAKPLEQFNEKSSLLLTWLGANKPKGYLWNYQNKN